MFVLHSTYGYFFCLFELHHAHCTRVVGIFWWNIELTIENFGFVFFTD